jgi:ATP phosphoribosyltransferase
MRDDGQNALFDQVYELDFGHCRLSIAAPEETPFDGPASLQSKRIATSYIATLADFLQRHSVDAEIVFFSGAVEIAPKLGKADFICDLVATGATLAANQLREVQTILESEAIIIQTRAPLGQAKQDWVNRILQRLNGVLQVRESKYIMLHAPRSALARISALLPGSEYPTVIPLDGQGDKVAVHAVCRENVFWETLENLKDAGASSLLVLPVEKMLS